jgi:hypothetical protein
MSKIRIKKAKKAFLTFITLSSIPEKKIIDFVQSSRSYRNHAKLASIYFIPDAFFSANFFFLIVYDDTHPVLIL